MTAGSEALRRVLARTPVAPLPASSPTRPTGITGRMSAPPETSSPGVCSVRLPQMCGFRLPLTERPADPSVPPLGILDRHPDHARGHVTSRHRPASTAAGAAVVCLGDQSPVPAENRVRRDDAGDLHPDAPSEFLAAHGESTALGIGPAKRPRAQVLPEDPILLPEIRDQIVLVAVHPASERENEEL